MRSPIVSTKIQQIAEQASQYPDMVFTTLMHQVDVEFLREAYRQTRKSGAPGASGQTAKEYTENLAENLDALYDRMCAGQYRAPPVKRVWLDKADGGQRPIGIPEFEDKLVQRAVNMLLEAVYEQDFHPFSHGFRKGRSAHQALHELRTQCLRQNTGWIIDADVQGFFDHLPHDQLREIVKRRVNDGGVLRHIGKWLNAGVLEGESRVYPDKGTPQGGVISPLLGNIFLHHVLDEWFVREVQPRMRGRCFLTRYADDFIIGCELESDARRILAVLPKRFAGFGLAIHPEKTRLVRFRKPSAGQETEEQLDTFDFLGFTHYWALSRRGHWVIKRQTARKRLKRTLKALWRWCRNHRHLPIKEQIRVLSAKLRGHYQYYGLRGNYRKLEQVYRHVRRAWQYWLSKRSNKSKIPWEKFALLLRKHPLPKPRIMHAI